MKLFTSKNSKLMDEYAIKKLSVPPIVLMEHASRGVYEELAVRFWPLSDKNFIVLCGTGNNGGDALCITRMLLLDGAGVSVFLMNGSPSTDEAKTELMVLKKTFPSLKTFDGKKTAEIRKRTTKNSIIIDGVFGTGFSSKKPLPKHVKDAFKVCEKALFKLSIDVPSGLSADTGELSDGAFKADISVSFGVPKVGLYTAPGALNSERVAVKSLFVGTPNLETPYELLTEETARKLIKPLKRTLNAHKGKYGHLAIISPQKGMEGAVAMCALSALRAGTGLVSIIATDETQEALRKRMPMLTSEIMIKTLKNVGVNFKNFSAVVIGPGFGKSRKKEFELIVKKCVVPIVIDADAINLMAEDKNILAFLRKSTNVILTPHPGEMARLCKKNSEQVQKSRLSVLETFCKGAKFTVLLKGFRSILHAPDGRVFINPTGGPALAKGGSGDVLSGIVGAFLAQGLKPYEAGALGMYVHGSCADKVINEKAGANFTLLPTDVINELGETMGWLTE